MRALILFLALAAGLAGYLTITVPDLTEPHPPYGDPRFFPGVFVDGDPERP